MRGYTWLSRLPTARLRARVAELELLLSEADAAQRDLSVRLVRSAQTTSQLRAERMEFERKLKDVTSIPLQPIFEHLIEAANDTFLEATRSDLYGNAGFLSRIITRSGLFEKSYYLERNPELAQVSSPLEHFITVGGSEGRAPGPQFSSARYLADNRDVAAAGLNPLAHYLIYGFREGRRVQTDD